LIPSQHYAELALEYEEERRALAGRILAHARERLRSAGHPATGSIRCGDAAEEIIAAAREEKADLIVVGSANRSALGRLFLGSVSARVLSHAPCSVLIARAKSSVNA
jgi:nucleotide-binding universal stress UspA family protein